MGSESGASNTTRREFVVQAAAGLATAVTAANLRAQSGTGPGGRIRVAFIGLGGMGMGRLRQFMKHEDVEVAALCDVDENHLTAAQAEVEKQAGRRPERLRDFRRVLDRRDVDAVAICTPDHWHALPTIMACQAGKDVFVEKPLSYSIGEGRLMADAARKHGRVTQMGNHIHNDLPNYRRVVELVRSGRLGRIDRVYCWKRSESKGLGNPPDGDPPKGLDYDFWLGPAPKRRFNPNRAHFNYRYFWDYSGGMFIDFWCHITDVAYWALDLQAPRSVSASGFRNLADDNAETPNVLEAVYEYPGLLLTWGLHPVGLPGWAGVDPGCAFIGSEATLVTAYGRHEVFVKGKPEPGFPRPEPSIPDSPGHIREFLDSVKSRKETNCNLQYSHRLSKAGLLGCISFRVGRKILWDDARERIEGDSKAQSLVKRRYRKPWRL